MELTDLLQTVPLFSAFNQAELAALEKSFSVASYPSGHFFTREGERGTSLFLIVEGKVHVTRKKRSGPGFDVEKRLKAGEVFGFVSLIDPGPCTATCQADGPVKVASMPREVVKLLLNKHASIAKHFQDALCEQLTKSINTERENLGELLSAGDTKKIRELLEAVVEIRPE